MIGAFKFLAPGAVSPFTGFRWPAVGSWVSAADDDAASWIFACRDRDLPYWVDAELWQVELDGPIRVAPFQISAARARLAGRVERWDHALRLRYTQACALRARDLAVPSLPASLQAQVAGLEAPAAIAEAVGSLSTASPLAGYLADVARTTENQHPAATSYVTCMLAASLGGGQAAFEAERAWQARWLVGELGLG